MGRNSYSTFFDKCYDLLAVEDLRGDERDERDELVQLPVITYDPHK